MPELFGRRADCLLVCVPLVGRAAGEATCAGRPHPLGVGGVGGARVAGLVVLRRVSARVATIRVLLVLLVVVVRGGAVVLVGAGG